MNKGPYSMGSWTSAIPVVHWVELSSEFRFFTCKETTVGVKNKAKGALDTTKSAEEATHFKMIRYLIQLILGSL